MDADLCKLTIVYPPASENALLHLLEAHEPPLPGFTTWSGAGHGFGFEGASHAERVRGQVARRLMVMIVPLSVASDILAQISESIPIPHLVYWTEPVLSAGRLI